MPRRTSLDTIFDNARGNTPVNEPEMLSMGELSTLMSDEGRAVLARAQANGAAVDGLPMHPDDYTQFNEGLAGEDEGDGYGGEGGGGYGEDSSQAMPDDEYQALIAKGIEAAENYVDMEISPDRELAARYYRGEKFGNEEENRSKVVMTSVRDTVLSLMPALLRVFCGTRDAVEFINNEGTPAGQAEEQTAYVNHIINSDNPGFMIHHSAFKDALVRRTGIFTWWHEEKDVAESEICTGLDETAYALLQMEEKEASEDAVYNNYRIEVLDERPDTTSPSELPEVLAGEDPAPPQGQNLIRDVEIIRAFRRKRHRVAAVPPEEFILTPMTSDNLDEYQLVGRRQMKSIGEIVALGHNEDTVREAVGAGTEYTGLNQNAEALDRNPNVVERLFDSGFSKQDPQSEYVKYCVVYVLVDRDGDGILERRKVVTVGPNNVIVYDRCTSEMVPFAIICPDPEPHSPFGYSVADQTMDMQEIQSEIVRGILDSLAESIIGRTAIVEGKVNIDDALSSDRDQLVRTKEQGAIWSLARPFSGQNALPVLEYLDNVKARRTGVTLAPAGLSPDVLQSTSTSAVDQVVDASQERAEMIARIFAETGIRRMFQGLQQQVVRHQDKKRQIRLRGKMVSVDPRSFVANLDLQVNVGLGRGTAAKRFAALTGMYLQQKEIYMTFGPTNPFVQAHHISNCLVDMAHESDIADPSRYMNIITPEQSQQMKLEAQQQPPKPTPEEILAKQNTENNQAKLAIAQEAEKTRRIKTLLDDDQKRDAKDQDFYLKAGELLGKFGIQVNEAEMRAKMEQDRSAENLADKAQEGAAAEPQVPSPPNGMMQQ